MWVVLDCGIFLEVFGECGLFFFEKVELGVILILFINDIFLNWDMRKFYNLILFIFIGI